MQSLPPLAIDLALILAVAAIATIVCRRLKQPLVLGYVLAGFLVSPAISWFPDVSDTESISVWSEIGVIFLMFGLGLEFSITRLATAGRPAILTALIEMGLMMVAGFTCGTLLGWPLLTSLFLGGMIAISSTTIIAKTFDELHLKDKGFAGLVFGVLVIQDITAVFLMVVLSTLAVGTNIDGEAVSVKLGRMALYLIVWFVLTVIFASLRIAWSARLQAVAENHREMFHEHGPSGRILLHHRSARLLARRHRGFPPSRHRGRFGAHHARNAFLHQKLRCRVSDHRPHASPDRPRLD